MTDATADDGARTGVTFAGQFAQPSREQWRKLVAGVLRKSRAIGEQDAPDRPEDLLATTTYDGLRLSPLYDASDAVAGVPGVAPYVRGGRAAGASADGWDVRQLHADPDAGRTAEAVLADLENGVGSVFLRTGDGAVDPADFPRVLKEVLLDLAPVALEPGAGYEAAAEALLQVYRDRNTPVSEVRASLGADPVSVTARTGAAADLAVAAALAVRVKAEFPNVKTVVADAQPFHEAGASDAQELGAATAAGVAYLRALTAAGLSVDDALKTVEFRFAATADQFGTIAKLRAARRLWARVAEASGGDVPQTQHAVTSWAMTTQRDPWVNMLRTTVASFAAGVGGADAVTVRPFDAAIGLPDDFARRIARNTQSLLLEESHIAQVIDPAGGSWYVETRTDELAHKAWSFFQEIEAAGGILKTLSTGWLDERFAAVRAERTKALAHRTDPLTGVSEFPNLTEVPVVRAPEPAYPTGGLPRARYAQPYETLRDRSDQTLETTGKRPEVFFATIGPVAQHTARLGFVKNLFAAGGIEGPDADVSTAVQVPKVAVLASSDKLYADQAADAVAALKAAGAEFVWLAGAARKWADTGADGYVYAGCDALKTLETTYDILAGEAR